MESSSHERAIERIRDILDQHDAWLDESNAHRERCYARFQKLFAPDAIDNLTADQFKEFLSFKNNRHWTGLERHGGRITADMSRLKRSLHRLIEESVPIETRLDSMAPGEEFHTDRLGRAIFTPVLMISYPEKYTVWNNTAKVSLQNLGLWPKFPRGATVGKKYALLNDKMLGIANELDIDTWTLDAVWHRVRAGDRPTVASEGTEAWIVRGGRDGEREHSAQKHSVAMIDYGFPDDLSGFDSVDAIVARLREIYPKYSEQQLTSRAQQIWSFATDINEGEIVVMPLKTRPTHVAVAEVVGEYEHREINGEMIHTIPLSWLGELAREKLPGEVVSVLNVPRTVIRVPDDDAGAKISDAFEMSAVRENADVAREIFESWFPKPEARRDVLKAFAEGIREAHAFSPAGYAVVLPKMRDRIRLNIGSTQAAVLRRGTADFVVTESALREEAASTCAPYLDRSFDYKMADGLVDVVVPYEELNRVYPLIRDPFRRRIHHPDQAVRVAQTYTRHSPGILAYLRQELGEDVPDPIYPEENLRRHGTRTQLDMFTPQTFELLADLHEQCTKQYYSEHKTEFQTHLIRPFRAIMRAVAERLPDSLTLAVETEQRIFSRIPKNDYGKGGAWDFYWGAFYPKGGKRTDDAQLALWINRNIVQISFFLGVYAKEPKSRFDNNMREHSGSVLELLERTLGDDFIIASRGEVGQEPTETGLTPRDIVENPGEFYAVHRVLPREEVLAMDADAFVSLVAESFERLAPLMAAAISGDLLREFIVVVDGPGGGDDDPNDPYSLAQCADVTGFDEETLESWVAAIERKGQAVFYGPPGTGKTYVAKHLAKHLIAEDDGFSEIVQFHPAYAYEDFMQGLRPKPREDGGLDFELVAGRFIDFCRRARTCNGRCVLIVDEINRANLARVFGELMYLLEYRREETTLASGGDTFSIPKNVRVIGTMNTADRSIAVVDHALRRRFAFISLQPNYELLQAKLDDSNIDSAALIRVLQQINTAIDDPNYAIGVSFFLGNDLDKHLASIWHMEIEPYLEEYFFDRPKTVDDFRWREVRKSLLPGTE